MYRPDLLRTITIALVVALAANVWLIPLTADDDWFANVVGAASAFAAVAVAAAAAVPGLRHYLDEAFLLAFAIWLANLVELETQSGLGWDVKLRQGGFYLALAVVALGGYVAARTAQRHVTDGR